MVCRIVNKVGVRSQESGVRSQEFRSQESGVRNQEKENYLITTDN
ncbi:hypothetical protein [Dolichospermum sp. UHCC 0352]|nr:hypothetical protein [Dolichospermum sp. UHCC 0352]